MHRFSNIAKMVSLGTASWDEARDFGLLGIRAHYSDGASICTTEGHRFINMCSCSYLGLDRHPTIIAAALEALSRSGVLLLPTSRTRIGLQLINDVEDALSSQFKSECIVTVSCAAASAGILSLLASGVLTSNECPLMVFDKHCHFSMSLMKPVCGDETEVVTCEHNDIDFLADACRKHRRVVYVADGAYSMGGYAPVRDLLALQAKYGLFLYFDDSHSVSVFGPRGEGFVRAQCRELSERTIVVASLGKAFGASGGVIFLGPKSLRDQVEVFGGPMGWSQTVNTAGLGGILGSVEVHQSAELVSLQGKLQNNIVFFDSLCPTNNAGNFLPIRVVELEDPRTAIQRSREIYRAGFYSSAVFFPVVACNRAGLRVMARADLSHKEILDFVGCVESAKNANDRI